MKTGEAPTASDTGLAQLYGIEFTQPLSKANGAPGDSGHVSVSASLEWQILTLFYSGQIGFYPEVQLISAQVIGSLNLVSPLWEVEADA